MFSFRFKILIPMLFLVTFIFSGLFFIVSRYSVNTMEKGSVRAIGIISEDLYTPVDTTLAG